LSSETLKNLTASDFREVAGQASMLRCTYYDCTATKVCSGCAPCA
jgi:hypothetical protein